MLLINNFIKLVAEIKLDRKSFGRWLWILIERQVKVKMDYYNGRRLIHFACFSDMKSDFSYLRIEKPTL